MGIPKFKKALTELLGYELINKPSGKCSALYLDANSLLHPATSYDRESRITEGDYPECAKLVIDAIESVINHYEPTDLIYISVDGPVPMAKIQEQRERRYYGGVQKQKNDYSSDLLTPGTDIMFVIHNEIMDKIARDKSKYYVKKLVYSSHKVPGEGEHKIMGYIRKNKAECESYTGSHVIYGNDSDLIILGLCTNIKEVYIANDTVELTGSISRPDEMYNVIIKERTNKKELSIDNIRTGLLTKIGNDKENDFIYACSLLGNDFLPRTPIFSNISKGLNIIVDHLANGGEVIKDNCLSIFRRLAEEETLQNEDSALYSLLVAHNSKIVDESGYTQYPSKIFKAIKANDNEDKDWDDLFRYFWYTKALMYLGFDEFSLPTLGKMCCEYITGLNWIYNYYTRGQDSVTWLWYYPYHHAPLFSDLALTVEAANEGIIKDADKAFFNTDPYDEEERFTSLHQLVSVMPPQSTDYIPKDLHYFYSSNSPLIHFMPLTVFVNDEFTETSAQIKGILPKVDYWTIMNELSKRMFSSSVVSKYSNVSSPHINELPLLKQRPRKKYDQYPRSDRGERSDRG